MPEAQPVAEIWYCGDDECDCTQPQIVTRTPRPLRGGGTVYDKKVLWEGTFLSESFAYTSDELEELQYRPLREACERYGIPIPKELRDANG